MPTLFSEWALGKPSSPKSEATMPRSSPNLEPNSSGLWATGAQSSRASSRSRNARRRGTISGCRSLARGSFNLLQLLKLAMDMDGVQTPASILECLLYTAVPLQSCGSRTYSCYTCLVWSITSWTKPGSPRQECKSKTLMTHGVWSYLGLVKVLSASGGFQNKNSRTG